MKTYQSYLNQRVQIQILKKNNYISGTDENDGFEELDDLGRLVNGSSHDATHHPCDSHIFHDSPRFWASIVEIITHTSVCLLVAVCFGRHLFLLCSLPHLQKT